jgi:7,8-dihydropterin-6-yl-methyl-4-(beta-D-ribofuranosyl)aminobenzene 5'-phosphate synthase
VLSHAHDDHSGGLVGLLPLLRPGIPLYANATLFRRRYSAKSGQLESRGMPLHAEALGEHVALHLDDTPQQVLEGVWTTGRIVERPEAEGRSPHHYIPRGDGHVPDPYDDDLSLVLQLDDGVFCLCGCCHAGLLNTLAQIRRTWEQPIAGIAGGVHLNGATRDTMRRTQREIQGMGALRHVWLSHCSGKKFVQLLDKALPGGLLRRGQAGDQQTLI